MGREGKRKLPPIVTTSKKQKRGSDDSIAEESDYEESNAEDESMDNTDLEKKRVPELKEILKSLGDKNYSKLKKPELIERIKTLQQQKKSASQPTRTEAAQETTVRGRRVPEWQTTTKIPSRQEDNKRGVPATTLAPKATLNTSLSGSSDEEDTLQSGRPSPSPVKPYYFQKTPSVSPAPVDDQVAWIKKRKTSRPSEDSLNSKLSNPNLDIEDALMEDILSIEFAEPKAPLEDKKIRNLKNSQNSNNSVNLKNSQNSQNSSNSINLKNSQTSNSQNSKNSQNSNSQLSNNSQTSQGSKSQLNLNLKTSQNSQEKNSQNLKNSQNSQEKKAESGSGDKIQKSKPAPIEDSDSSNLSLLLEPSVLDESELNLTPARPGSRTKSSVSLDDSDTESPAHKEFKKLYLKDDSKHTAKKAILEPKTVPKKLPPTYKATLPNKNAAVSKNNKPNASLLSTSCDSDEFSLISLEDSPKQLSPKPEPKKTADNTKKPILKHQAMEKKNKKAQSSEEALLSSSEGEESVSVTPYLDISVDEMRKAGANLQKASKPLPQTQILDHMSSEDEESSSILPGKIGNDQTTTIVSTQCLNQDSESEESGKISTQFLMQDSESEDTEPPPDVEEDSDENAPPTQVLNQDSDLHLPDAAMQKTEQLDSDADPEDSDENAPPTQPLNQDSDLHLSDVSAVAPANRYPIDSDSDDNAPPTQVLNQDSDLHLSEAAGMQPTQFLDNNDSSEEHQDKPEPTQPLSDFEGESEVAQTQFLQQDSETSFDNFSPIKRNKSLISKAASKSSDKKKEKKGNAAFGHHSDSEDFPDSDSPYSNAVRIRLPETKNESEELFPVRTESELSEVFSDGFPTVPKPQSIKPISTATKEPVCTPTQNMDDSEENLTTPSVNFTKAAQKIHQRYGRLVPIYSNRPIIVLSSKPIKFGSDKKSDICFPFDNRISKDHCSVRIERNNLFVKVLE